MRGGRRTMADVSRSLPALAQPPATASPSHPAAPLAASHQAAAADLGQWREAPPATSHPVTAHPAYFYPTTLVSLGSGVKPASNESQEYHDPAIVETGSEPSRFQPADPVWVRNFGHGRRWCAGVIRDSESSRLVKVDTPEGPTRRHLDPIRPRMSPGAPKADTSKSVPPSRDNAEQQASPREPLLSPITPARMNAVPVPSATPPTSLPAVAVSPTPQVLRWVADHPATTVFCQSPPVPVGAGQDGPQGSLPKATAVAMRGGRRTMADVSRSLPALAQPPATASPSHPAAPLAASHQAAAADLGQATPEVGTWKVANFLQAAWTTAADTDGCVFYESKKYNR
ncbi:hypothetical protein MRX96_016109 [Rhipicephalus microplus]